MSTRIRAVMLVVALLAGVIVGLPPAQADLRSPSDTETNASSSASFSVDDVCNGNEMTLPQTRGVGIPCPGDPSRVGPAGFPRRAPSDAESVSGWSIVPSPNVSDVTTINELSGVACVSSTDCWAVGSRLFDGSYRTLTQRWDGTSWTSVTSPNPTDTRHNHLFGVTCASTNLCWAVGYADTDSLRETLILKWDGSEWTLDNLPPAADTEGGFLTAATCASTSECWAVGASVQGGDVLDPATYDPLIARWDGLSWTIVPSPAGSSGHEFLYGVTCSSANDCWAVGYQGGSTWQTLILRWNGTLWAVVESPNNSTTEHNFLFGVSCGSSEACSAVGLYTDAEEDLDRTLILRWDGSAWTVAGSPNGDATRHSSLFGVSCTSASDCQAVGYGYFEGSAHWRTLILRWDGSSWAIVPSPNTDPTQHNILYGIACASGTDCWAVGTHAPRSDPQTLTERWDGESWTIVGSPNLPGKQRNQLFGVTCLSTSDCWAVGVYRTSATDQTLIMRWDGTSWAMIPSPNVGVAKKNVLTSVTCVSTSDCWAVGQHTPGFNDQSLTMHWDGTAWSIVASPNTSDTKAHRLNDVTCTSSSNCWAVGEYLSPSFSLETLTMRWDGASWVIVTSPNLAGQRNVLNGVTCVSAADCWAVGFADTDEGDRTLIERWDGTSWSIVTSANIPTRDNKLAAVACNSSSDCWAVGNYHNGLAEQTLIERWDGASWTITPSPNTVPTSYNYLTDVSCVSPTECWAVGYAWTVGSPQTATLLWDGATWTRIASPSTSESHDNYLSKVSCLATSDCMAVGYYLTTQTGTAQTLTLQYLGEPVEPTPTPTPTPTPSETATATPTPTPTETPSPTPTETATPTPDPTASESADPDPTTSSSPSPTPTATVSPEPTGSPTSEPTEPPPGGGGGGGGGGEPSAAPSQSSAPPVNPTAIGTATTTIATSRTLTGFRRGFELSGVVTRSDDCSGALEVTISRRVHGTDSFLAFASTPVSATDTWNFAVPARRNASYIAQVRATDTCQGTPSAPTDVLVKARVKARLKATAPRTCGGTIRGRVRPDHAGTKVILQQRRRGTWTRIARDRLDDHSRFAFKARRCGLHRVVWPSQGDANERGVARVRL